MFGKKKNILYITRDKLMVLKIKLAKNPQKRIIAQFNWNSENLDEIAKKVKKIAGKSIPTLVDDNLAYITAIPISEDQHITAALIKSRAQEMIPDSLSQTLWNYQETPLRVKKEHHQEFLYQLFFLTSRFYTAFQPIVTSHKVNLTPIQSISQLIAHQFKTEKQPVVVMYYSSVILTFHGVVFSTTVSSTITMDSIQSLLQYSQKYFQLTPTKIIVHGNLPTLDLAQLKKLGVTLEKQTIDPFTEFARLHAIKNDSLNMFSLAILSSTPKEAPEQDVTEAQPSTEEDKKSKNIKVLLFVAFLTIILGINAVILFQRKQSQSTSSAPPPPVTATATPTSAPNPTETEATPAAVLKSEYTITILNGSGTPGRAGELQEKLEALDYTILDVGNADATESSTIQFKESVPESFEKLLIEDLESLNLETIEPLLNTNESDVIVVIGEQ